jgi:hypothetical protein
MKNGQLSLIKKLLEANHIYEELPDKALHKLSYLVYKESQERGIDLSIPYFWYRYGVLTQQATPSTSTTPSPELDSDEEEALNNITETILEKYYDSSLKELTDLTYKDAPYEVFRHWRELDKQISRLDDHYNPFFDNTPIREELEDKIEKVYDSFPVTEFPQHEADISTWYFAMVRELDMGMQNIQRLHKVNTVFWGIFTLSVAEKHHYNMTEEEVLQALGIRSIESELETRRSKLRKLERKGLDDRFDESDDELTVATDAMIEPILESL